MKNLTLLAALALVSAGATACKKSESGGAAGDTDPSAETAAETGAGETAGDPAQLGNEARQDDQKAAASDKTDYIKVLAKHAPDPKPDDPVEVEIQKFRVVKADFDPDNLEGASAELELDLASLSSGVDKRDKHLMSPDYLDVSQFSTARVVVSDVKKVKKDGDRYKAVARVSAHGIEKEFPVTFEVTNRTDSSIRIEGQHAFQRGEFKIGKKEGDPTQQELVIEMALTLEKTS